MRDPVLEQLTAFMLTVPDNVKLLWDIHLQQFNDMQESLRNVAPTYYYRIWDGKPKDSSKKV